MINNTKQLVNRQFDKYLSVYNLKSKYDLISRLIEVLNKFLPEDIHEVKRFTYEVDNSIQPLIDSNCNFYIEYKGLETAQEFKERLIQEQIDKDKKIILLNRLAAELDYKLEKVND